jgi:hypothetical protein
MPSRSICSAARFDRGPMRSTGASLLSIAAVRKVYSITSSARASTVPGMVRPSVLAVLRLMTRSNLVGCSTGNIGGLRSAQNLVDDFGGAPELICSVGPIRHQTSRFDSSR